MKVSDFRNYLTIPMLGLVTAISIGATAGWTQPSVIELPDGTRSMKVSYSDLNLRSDSGVEILNRRVRHAANIVCGVSRGTPLGEYQRSRKCYRKSVSRATHAVKVAVARVRGGTQFASANGSSATPAAQR
jgi:UrcA family protein